MIFGEKMLILEFSDNSFELGQGFPPPPLKKLLETGLDALIARLDEKIWVRTRFRKHAKNSFDRF